MSDSAKLPLRTPQQTVDDLQMLRGKIFVGSEARAALDAAIIAISRANGLTVVHCSRCAEIGPAFYGSCTGGGHHDVVRTTEQSEDAPCAIRKHDPLSGCSPDDPCAYHGCTDEGPCKCPGSQDVKQSEKAEFTDLEKSVVAIAMRRFLAGKSTVEQFVAAKSASDKLFAIWEHRRAEQAKGRVFEIDDALADVAIEGIYGADRVRDMKADHDFFYTEYADMRRDQKAAIRAVFDKVGLPFTDAPKNEGVANAK